MSENTPWSQVVTRPPVVAADARGTIRDLFMGEPFDSATVITCVRGSIRGNHYHRETHQVMYVMRGRVRVVIQLPGEGPREQTAETGDLIWTPPVERHAFLALEDTDLMVLTRGPRSGANFESDTVRLDERLIR